MDLIDQASQIYNKNFPPIAWFERAVFLSWFCAKPTCRFCYMYTIKDQIKRPRKARRRLESILAETLIAKVCNWEIGFISAGIASWSTPELKEVLEGMHKILDKKVWLNLGPMQERQIKELLPYITGVTGTVETVNFRTRDKIVPDKPLSEIEAMFEIADKYDLMTSITIIIGLGESIEDFPNLARLIRKWNVNRINFYRLVPHEGADLFPTGPKTEYYAEWIARTRIQFPRLNIIAGSWPNRTVEIPILLKAGANAITKLPAIKYFGKKPAKEIQDGAKKAGRRFVSELVDYPRADINNCLSVFDRRTRDRIRIKYLKYLKKING